MTSFNTIKRMSLLLMLFLCQYSYSQTAIFSKTITEGVKKPLRLAIDRQNYLYVVDESQNRILKYTPSGTLSATYNLPFIPHSIAVNSNSEIFCGSTVTGEIYKINSNNSVQLFYAGTSFPTSMAFDDNGNLYISDSKYKKVFIIDSNGTKTGEVGAGVLIRPTGVDFDSKNNRIIVAEHGGIGTGFSPTVKVYGFDLQGNQVLTFGSSGNTNGKFYRIQGISVDNCGNIFVLDPLLATVSVFNENGTFITKFGDFGLSQGQLDLPLDVVSNKSGDIFVSNRNSSSIEVFNITNTLPFAQISANDLNLCTGETATIPVTLHGTSPWSIKYSIDGQNAVTISDILQNTYLINVSNPGRYVVNKVTDANGTSTCLSGYTDVKFFEFPQAVMSCAKPDICTGENAIIDIALSGTPPWDLTYTKDGINPVTINGITQTPYTLQVGEQGTYAISQLSSANCNATSITGTVNITVNDIAVSDFSFTVNGNVVSFTNTSQNAVSYYWDFGDFTSSIVPDPVHTFNTVGIYEASLLVSNKCNQISLQQGVTISNILSVEEVGKNELLSIFPNPASEKINIIQNQGNSIITYISIINSQGVLLFAKKVTTADKTFTIDVSKYKEGLYIIKSVSGINTYSKKIIISRH